MGFGFGFGYRLQASVSESLSIGNQSLEISFQLPEYME